MKDRDKEKSAMEANVMELMDQNKALERDKAKMEERQQHLDKVKAAVQLIQVID